MPDIRSCSSFLIKMRLLIIFNAIALLAVSCTQSTEKKRAWDIKGSWYTFSKDRGGLYDSILNYTEFYINDSIREVQEETFGQHGPQQYFIKEDSIYLCFGTDKACEFIPMYKIKQFERDTLWLSINPKWTKGGQETYWVKFPKDEKGQFDYDYTPENSDSLGWAVVFGWERRRDKYFSMLTGRSYVYDSLLITGRYDWSMSIPMIQEQRERRKTREQKN
jgi:hypothetical protein